MSDNKIVRKRPPREGEGRPLDSKGKNTLTENLHWRLTAPEKAELQRRAAEQGLNVSAYLREMCLGGYAPPESED